MQYTKPDPVAPLGSWCSPWLHGVGWVSMRCWRSGTYRYGSRQLRLGHSLAVRARQREAPCLGQRRLVQHAKPGAFESLHRINEHFGVALRNTDQALCRA